MQLQGILAGGVVLIGGAVVLVFGAPPAWLTLLLGTIALALLYTFARLKSRYDPLDDRFGSCIPPPPGWKKPRGDV